MKTTNRLKKKASRATAPTVAPTVKQRTNGHSNIDPQSTVETPLGVSTSLARILRPQAAYRWILPYISAITPMYIESTLRGALAGNHVQQWELFDLMLDTWPELSAIQQELIYGVQRRTIVFEPFHEEDQQPNASATERMKLVSSALRNMRPNAAADENDLDGTVFDILDGWFRGVTCLEIDWALSDLGQGVDQAMAPRCTFWVHPVCFGFNSDGTLCLRNPSAAGANYQAGTFGAPFAITTTPQTPLIEFPPNKFVVGIHKQKSGNALGGAMLRPLAWWWLAANFSADWLLNLAQVFGLPFRWANYDPNAPQATIDAICNMLQNMGSNGWAAFPAGTSMELKESGRTGSDHSPQGELLDRADRYARTLILGQTMTGGAGTTGKGGGQAFGRIEKDVKDDRIDAACKYVAKVVNGQIINPLLELNYGESDDAPLMRFLEEEEAEVTAAQRDEVLAAMGMKIGVNYLRKKYSIPEPAKGEETVGGPAPAGQQQADQVKPPRPQTDPMEAKDDEDLARFLGAQVSGFREALSGDLQPLRFAIETAVTAKDEATQRQNLATLQSHLPDILRQLVQRKSESAEELGKIIAESMAKGAEAE